MHGAITSKKVLVAALDWGLGHATRCVPVISEFLKQGCEVQIASSGDALTLLREEFPELKFHLLSPYNAKYSAALPLLVKVILQIPKFSSTIKKEHRQLEDIIVSEGIDLVISDNRYGCWSRNVKSIFICHQLVLKAPFSFVIAGLYEKKIRRFSECWVPDEEDGASHKPATISWLFCLVPNRNEVSLKKSFLVN